MTLTRQAVRCRNNPAGTRDSSSCCRPWHSNYWSCHSNDYYIHPDPLPGLALDLPDSPRLFVLFHHSYCAARRTNYPFAAFDLDLRLRLFTTRLSRPPNHPISPQKPEAKRPPVLFLFLFRQSLGTPPLDPGAA